MDQPKIDKGSMSEDDLDAFSQGESEAESRGGDHRPIQDNGTQGYRFNTQGQMSGNSDFTPIRDIFASYAPVNAEFAAGTINELGFEPGNKEVGHDGNQLCYGLKDDSPPAGGKGEQGQQGEGSYKNRQQ